jgi:hypothetical protein
VLLYINNSYLYLSQPLESIQNFLENLSQNYPLFPKCQQKRLTGFIFLAPFKITCDSRPA